VHASHSLQFGVGDCDVLLAGLSLSTCAGVLGWVPACLEFATTAASGAAAMIVLLLLFDERFHFFKFKFSLQN